MTKKVSMAEGFDILLNQLRYLKYYLFAVVFIPLIFFTVSFVYFISKSKELKEIVVYSAQYGLLSFKFWLLGDLLNLHKGADYYNYQNIYRDYFPLVFHSYAFYYSVAIAVFSIIVTFLIVRSFTRNLSDKKVIRGTKIKSLGSVSNLRKFIRPRDEVKHTIFIGSTGSGKTQAMHRLSKPVLNACKNVFFDVKGDYLPAYFKKGRDILINPLDVRSARWNFLEEVEDEADIDTLAKAFIEKNSSSFNDSKSAYFEGNASFVLQNIFKELHKNGILDNDKIREVILKEVFYKSNSGLVKNLIEKLNVGSDVSFADTLSTLRVSLDFIKVIGFEPKVNPKFSINEWLNSHNNSNIFLTTVKDKSSITKGFNTAFLTMLLLKLCSLPDVQSQDDVRVRIWIDELANLSKIPNLAETLSFVRSKGVAIYLSTQSLEGLKRSYQDHEIKDILNNCNNLFCFSANDDYTASIFSKLIGQQQVKIPSKSSFSTPKVSNIDGINLSYHRSIEYAVLPAEIMVLKGGEFYAKIRRKWFKAKLKFIPIKKDENIEFFLENKAFKLKSVKNKDDESEIITGVETSDSKPSSKPAFGGKSISYHSINKPVENIKDTNREAQSDFNDKSSKEMTLKSKDSKQKKDISQDNPLNIANKFME